MLIIGAKGFAKEVLEILHQKGDTENLCFYDDVSADVPDMLFERFPVLKSLDNAKIYFKTADNRFILGIGNPKLRKELCKKFSDLGGELTSVISKNAEIGSFGVEIGIGAIIMGGVKISNDVKIGAGVMIYYNSIITHDVAIGNFVEISPGVTVLGRAKIDDMCHIAAGSIIFPDVEIGKNTVIAAGSVVRENFGSNIMIAGIPAVIKKHL